MMSSDLKILERRLASDHVLEMASTTDYRVRTLLIVLAVGPPALT
jgi:hypothetical protein